MCCHPDGAAHSCLGASEEALGLIWSHSRGTLSPSEAVLGVFSEEHDAMGLCCLPLPDMDTDSGSSEMGCDAILTAQHTHVWVLVRRLGWIMSHS